MTKPLHFFLTFFILFIALATTNTRSVAEETVIDTDPASSEVTADDVEDKVEGVKEDPLKDIPPEKLKLANKLESLRPAWEELNVFIRNTAKQFPEHRRFAFIVAMERSIDKNAVKTAAVSSLAETFSEDELRALIRFYEDEDIQSGMAKMQEYKERLHPQVSELLDAALMKIRKSPGSEKLKQ